MKQINPVVGIAARFGGQTGLARSLGIKQSTVWEWVSKGYVPSRRIPEVIAAAAALTPPVALRPDHFFATPSVPVPAHPAESASR